MHAAGGHRRRRSHLTVQHGSSASNAGGISNDHRDGTLYIDRCTIAHNTAVGNGGGIYNLGYLWINDSTFDDNVAAYGGAIFNPAPFGSVVLLNSTVTANSASTEGGGMYSESAVILRSNIIAGNDAPSGPDVRNNTPPFYTSLVSRGRNLVGDDDGTNFTASSPDDQIGTSLAPIDARFAAAGLADNGGATQTVALQSASPARTSGACDANNGPPHTDPSEFDQRDIPRSSPCSVGAFDVTSVFYGGFEP
jgi:hypothetical protein